VYKKFLIITAVMLAGAVQATPWFTQDRWGYKFFGYVKHESFWDTRQIVGGNDDQNLLYPENRLFDPQGNDINAHGEFNTSVLETRMGFAVDGPPVGQAKSLALIEWDLIGRDITEPLDVFALRHAYVQIEWECFKLIAGQTWHPLALPMTDTISFNQGNPISAYGRSPQVFLSYKLGCFEFWGAALSQIDFTSDGPQGESSEYLRNAVMPNLNFQVHYHIDEANEVGVMVDIKRLVPRLETLTGYKAYESIMSYSADAFVMLHWPRWFLISEVTFASNLYEFNTLGGYAVHSVEPVTDHRTYTNVRSVSWWVDTAMTKTHKLQPGIFLGVVKNIGAPKTVLPNVVGPDGTIIDQRVYVLGPNVDTVFRISPRFRLRIADQCTFGVEIEYTRAAYGTMTADAKVTNTSPVGNTRLLGALYYYF
jgi:hypothetical protein